MSSFVPFNRDQAFLLPPDLKAWLPEVSIDGTKIDANASKIRSVCYDRMKELCAKLTADIRGADRPGRDRRRRGLSRAGAAGGAGPARSAEGEARCAQDRLEAAARAEAEAARPDYEAKKAAYDAKQDRRGRPPKSPDDEPPPERQNQPDRSGQRADAPVGGA
jgi:hypothetical protein